LTSLTSVKKERADGEGETDEEAAVIEEIITTYKSKEIELSDRLKDTKSQNRTLLKKNRYRASYNNNNHHHFRPSVLRIQY